MANEKKKSVAAILLVLAAIAIAIILAFVKPNAPGKTETESHSPGFKHRVRGMEFISPPEKPVRRDNR